MAELADAVDSKSTEGNLVGVRPPLRHQLDSFKMCGLKAAFLCPECPYIRVRNG